LGPTRKPFAVRTETSSVKRRESSERCHSAGNALEVAA
jgi:hypothetical protein